MSIQLSESWLRSLHYTRRIHHLTTSRVPARLACRRLLSIDPTITTRLHVTHTRLYPTSLRYHPHRHSYVTIALKLPSVEDSDRFNKVETARARFDACLNPPKSLGNLWKAYVKLHSIATQTDTGVFTSEDYEKLILAMETHALSKRRSVYWSRIATAFQDAYRLKLHTRPMALAAVRAFGRTDQLDQARAVFEAIPIDSEGYTRLFHAALDCNLLDEALNVLREGVKAGESAQTLGLAAWVDLCLVKKNLRRAIEVYSEFKVPLPAGTRQSVYTAYIEMMRHHGHWDYDHLSVTDSQTLEHFVSSYAQLSGKESLPAKDRQLFSAANLDVLLTQFSFAPTGKTCDMLLDVQASAQSYAGIKHVLARMQQHAVQPTIKTTCILLKVLGNSMAPTSARKLYRQLERTHQLDHDTYTQFVHTFAELRLPSMAQEVVLQMEKRGMVVNAAAQVAIAHALASRGRFAEADTWMSRAQVLETAGKASDTAALDAYAVVMEAKIGRGDFQACLSQSRVLRTGVAGHVAINNRRIVKATVASLCALGHWDQLKVFLASLPIQLTAVTVYRILNSLVHSKTPEGKAGVPGRRIVEALQRLEQALDVRVNAGGLSLLIRGLGSERGDFRSAYRLYQDVRNEVRTGQRPWRKMDSVHRAMIEVAIDSNALRTAEHVWNGMASERRSRKTDGNKKPTTSWYNLLLNAYADREPELNFEQVKRIYEKLLRGGVQPDQVTYNILIKAFARSGNTESAHHVLQQMITAGHPPDQWTFNTLLQGWIAEKEWDLVEMFIKDIEKQKYGVVPVDLTTFNLLLRAILRVPYDHDISRLQRQQRWMEANQRVQAGTYALTSDAIWNVLQTATGITRRRLEQHARRLTARAMVSAIDVEDWFDLVGAAEARHQPLKVVKQHPEKQHNPVGFIGVFGKHLQPDTTTFRLFKTAFLHAGDTSSAKLLEQHIERLSS
ncbi:hypothetical protein BCR43DRAFT_493505 [Syncephalastrum racemosum]|uniref:Pentacotripeptide-repeat region of PRORP domain-containing protein n=1 Tax=Syncephalastrum racemosum TaxID=13706 RepID=A0A1X2HAN5_SYNRA|nr:hypothetical protein BCR43DRAFT_493505 [Syncephalastrum racemosum]